MADPHVLIIGGGAAGLAAAAELCEAGLRVHLVEARARLGGRIWTRRVRGWPMPIELGAEFIHGEPPETWDLVRRAGLLADEIPDARWRKVPSGLARVHDFWRQVEEVTAKIPKKGRDRSFLEFLQASRAIPPQHRALAREFVSGYDAAETARVSARWLSTRGEMSSGPRDRRQHRLVGGYDGIVTALRSRMRDKKLRVHLGTVVSEVHWGPSRVRIRARRAGRKLELRAAAAILTLPVGVWNAPPGSRGAVRFFPEIAEKRRVLRKLAMGRVWRVVLRFRSAFWDEAGFLRPRLTRAARKGDDVRIAFVHDSSAAFSPWWTVFPARAPMLTGWAGGDAAAPMVGLPKKEIFRIACDSLCGTLDIERAWLRRRLEGWHMHDWNTDPFARGAYSYALVGGSRASRLLARPISSTLFFAGEATEPEQSGTVAGAIASGRRAARQLLQAGSL